jgi:hypothetical protein
MLSWDVRCREKFSLIENAYKLRIANSGRAGMGKAMFIGLQPM